MSILRPVLLLVLVALAGCGKNPLAPPGLLSFGTGTSAVTSGGGSVRLGAPKVVSDFEGAREYTVTFQRVDVSQTGDDWIPVLTSTITVTTTAGTVAVIGSSVGVKPGEYHGVRVWFGSRLSAVAKPPNPVYWTPDEPVDGFDRSNPRVFSTRDGNLAFPFLIAPGDDVQVVFAFDFTDSFKFANTFMDPTIPAPYQAKLVLDKDTKYYPKITVRVSKFKG